MKIGALIGLVVVAGAGAALTAVVVWPRDRAESALAGGAPAVAGLAERVNDVALVEVRTGTGQFSVRRTAANTWEATEKGGYPVQFEKVKQVVVGLSQLRLAEQKTSRPDLYPKLGVQDPGGEVPEGERGPTLVTLKDAQGQPLASIIIGNSKWDSKPGVYIRRAGEAPSWLASGQLEIPPQVVAWMDAKLLEVPRDRVKSVTVTHADGHVLEINREKPTDTSFVVKDVPAGKELRSPTAGDPLGAGISSLHFDDVAPAAELKTEGEGAARPRWTADFRTFDGLVLVIQTFDRDGKVWAKLVAAFDEVLASAPLENRPAALKSMEDVRTEAESLNARLSPWAFVLPEWKATALGVTMTSLLKDTPPAMPASMEGTQPLEMPPIPQGPGMQPPVPPAPPGATPPPAPTGPPPPAPTGEPSPASPPEPE
ncbi:MAG: DUF4340 domain-containing protein [Phycisphaerales bacterium]